MADKLIMAMLEPNGRLRYSALVAYARQATHAEFVAHFLHPVLAGILIRQGVLEQAGSGRQTLAIEGKTLTLTDCGSTNGTLLNDDALKPNREYRLRAGDDLTFGRYRFACMPATELFVRLRA